MPWTTEITELENYFESVYTPHSIVISPFENIGNVDMFIESHLMMVKQNNGKPWFIPYLTRLQDLRNFLENNYESLRPFPEKPGNNKVVIIN